jgi:hypothetical protein
MSGGGLAVGELPIYRRRTLIVADTKENERCANEVRAGGTAATGTVAAGTGGGAATFAP